VDSLRGPTIFNYWHLRILTTISFSPLAPHPVHLFLPSQRGRSGPPVALYDCSQKLKFSWFFPLRGSLKPLHPQKTPASPILLSTLPLPFLFFVFLQDFSVPFTEPLSSDLSPSTRFPSILSFLNPIIFFFFFFALPPPHCVGIFPFSSTFPALVSPVRGIRHLLISLFPFFLCFSSRYPGLR